MVLYNNKYSPLFTKIFGHFAVFSSIFCKPSFAFVTVVELDACLDTLVEDGVVIGVDITGVRLEDVETEGVDNSFTPLPVTITPASIGGDLNVVDAAGAGEELVVIELPVATMFDALTGDEEIDDGVPLKLDGELATGTEFVLDTDDTGELATGAKLFVVTEDTEGLETGTKLLILTGVMVGAPAVVGVVEGVDTETIALDETGVGAITLRCTSNRCVV